MVVQCSGWGNMLTIYCSRTEGRAKCRERAAIMYMHNKNDSVHPHQEFDGKMLVVQSLGQQDKEHNILLQYASRAQCVAASSCKLRPSLAVSC